MPSSSEEEVEGEDDEVISDAKGDARREKEMTADAGGGALAEGSGWEEKEEERERCDAADASGVRKEMDGRGRNANSVIRSCEKFSCTGKEIAFGWRYVGVHFQ